MTNDNDSEYETEEMVEEIDQILRQHWGCGTYDDVEEVKPGIGKIAPAIIVFDFEDVDGHEDNPIMSMLGPYIRALLAHDFAVVGIKGRQMYVNSLDRVEEKIEGGSGKAGFEIYSPSKLEMKGRIKEAEEEGDYEEAQKWQEAVEARFGGE